MKSRFRTLRTLLVAVVAFATASCGFHLRGSYNLPEDIQTLSVTSFDIYNNLTRAMKAQLRLHHIDLVKPAKNISNLHLTSESYGESTLSLYQNSRIAEMQFSYTVSYSVTIASKGVYQFSTSLNRTYLDNPLTALAKSVEEEMLAQEMRVEATKQIMRQLGRLKVDIEEFELKKAEDLALNALYQGSKEEEKDIRIETRVEGKNKTISLPPLSFLKADPLELEKDRVEKRDQTKKTVMNETFSSKDSEMLQ